MRASVGLGVVMVAALLVASCEITVPGTVDPGPNFSIPLVQFDANYFYCVVEPQIIMGGLTGHACGDDGNGNQGCHYSNKVPEMALVALPQPVTCSGSGVTAVPTDPTQTADGTPASINLSQVSLQMNAMYMDAPVFLWPTQTIQGHPVQIYTPGDTAVTNILNTWGML